MQSSTPRSFYALDKEPSVKSLECLTRVTVLRYKQSGIKPRELKLALLKSIHLNLFLGQNIQK